ncbi:MAG: CvpA family protein [Pseudomonadota bacterium]
MSLIDWCILGVVLVSAIVGVFRGLVREVLGLAGLALSVFVAWRFGELLAPRLTFISTLPSVRAMAASVILFVVCWLICMLLTVLLVKLVRGTGLSLPDRLLGSGFGALRGIVVVAVLVMLAGMTPLKNDPWWQQSQFIPQLEWIAGELVKLAPAGWRSKVGSDQET